MDQFHFKVNLKGMIDLLSNHLYSTPHVFVRELIQNGVDAITARKQQEPEHQGKISMEIFSSQPSPTLYVEDNGIGLTEEEVHEFLAQIGQTSKKEASTDDFIGRFGVGLLSCFIVSDEIVLITRSIKKAETIEWRGKPDGSYTIKTLAQEMEPGTRIYLQSKPGFEHFFTAESIQEMASYYGEFLPYPLIFYGEETVRLNAERAPWEMSQTKALEYGRQKWKQNFLDAIPLYSPLGEAKGMAYILPYPVSVNAKKAHRVYVKQMLLSERVEKILPDWSFFVTAVINVNQLRPTASREEFYDDPMLDRVKHELGEGIKQYLIQLANVQSPLLERMIQTHYSSLKLLACEDDELYRLFIDWFPFETSLGTLKMEEIRNFSHEIHYTSSLDEFRQMSQVAKAQSLCVINGAYMYDTQLLRKLPLFFPEWSLKEIDPTSFTSNFTDLTLDEREKAHHFLRLANIVLQPYQCVAEMKTFDPLGLPALYTTNDEAYFLRTVEHTKEETNELFASVIDAMASHHLTGQKAQLCFNYQNPIIQKAIQTKKKELHQLIVEMLYVQSLLLGHYPLRKQEYHLLNKGILRLIELELH